MFSTNKICFNIPGSRLILSQGNKSVTLEIFSVLKYDKMLIRMRGPNFSSQSFGFTYKVESFPLGFLLFDLVGVPGKEYSQILLTPLLLKATSI